jgi:hypothetical protein
MNDLPTSWLVVMTDKTGFRFMQVAIAPDRDAACAKVAEQWPLPDCRITKVVPFAPAEWQKRKK